MNNELLTERQRVIVEALGRQWLDWYVTLTGHQFLLLLAHLYGGGR